MESLQILNKEAWGVVDRYTHLKLGKVSCSTPYFTNDVGRMFGRLTKMAGLSEEESLRIINPYKENQMPFGHYQGKGRPEELEKSFVEIAQKEGIDINTFTSEGAREFMLLTGLGIDCSGLAYNVYGQLFGPEKLNEILAWKHAHEPYFAKAYAFAGEASTVIDPKEIRPLDMLLFRKVDMNGYYHIALILEKENRWKIVQSSSTAVPMGVNISDLKIEYGAPDFSFAPSRGLAWGELYRQGRIEFRRLALLTNLQEM